MCNTPRYRLWCVEVFDLHAILFPRFVRKWWALFSFHPCAYPHSSQHFPSDHTARETSSSWTVNMSKSLTYIEASSDACAVPLAVSTEGSSDFFFFWSVHRRTRVDDKLPVLSVHCRSSRSSSFNLWFKNVCSVSWYVSLIMCTFLCNLHASNPLVLREAQPNFH